MIELLLAAFVLVPILLVCGLVLGVLALAVVAVKAVLWLVFLPLRLAFWIVAAPLLFLLKSFIVLLTGAVLLPLVGVAAVVTVILGLLFVFLPALPLFFVAAIVWLIVKATKPRPVAA